MILAPDDLDSEGSDSPCAPDELADEDLSAGDSGQDEENVPAPNELCCGKLCLNGKDEAFSKQLAWLGTLARNFGCILESCLDNCWLGDKCQ